MYLAHFDRPEHPDLFESLFEQRMTLWACRVRHLSLWQSSLDELGSRDIDHHSVRSDSMTPHSEAAENFGEVQSMNWRL